MVPLAGGNPASFRGLDGPPESGVPPASQTTEPSASSWAFFIGRFDFTLSYRPGSKNGKPDALSRQFLPNNQEEDIGPIIPSKRIVAPVRWGIETGVRRALQQDPDPGPAPDDKMFIPRRARSEFLQWGHSSHFKAYPGVQRSLEFLRRRFWWPEMEREVKDRCNLFYLCPKQRPSSASSRVALTTPNSQSALVATYPAFASYLSHPSFLCTKP